MSCARAGPGEVGRGLSLFGPHRDDLKFLEVGPGAGQAGGDGEPAAAEAAGRGDAPAVPPSRRSCGGPVCGPVELPRGGRDLRLFGSQGEQRAAVLALLLAEQRLAAARTGQQGPLFLDDVMSELDDPRRRLLVRMLSHRGAGDHHDDQPALLHGRRSSPRRPSSSSRSTARSPPGRPRRRRTTQPAGAAGAGRAVTSSGDRKARPPGSGGERKRPSAGGRRDDLPRRLGDIIVPSLDKLAGGDEARAYAAWARAVGEPVTAGTRPKAFRRGQLTVECASSVWANELTYLGPQILRRMDEVAPGHPVKRFRFVVGRLPAPADGDEVAAEARAAAPEAAAARPPEQGSGAPRRRRSVGTNSPRPGLTTRRGPRWRESTTDDSGRRSRPLCDGHRRSLPGLPVEAPRPVDKNRRFAAVFPALRVALSLTVLIYSGRQVPPALRSYAQPLGHCEVV